MPLPLELASLILADDGTPISPAYGDVYHSAAGGHAQAKHVFMAGNSLPERWQRASRFVILETGFGLGINFLATWLASRGGSMEMRARSASVSPRARPAMAVRIRAPNTWKTFIVKPQ